MSAIAKIVPKPRGVYNASSIYNTLDIVRYGDKTWMCKVDGTAGIAPSEGATWTMMNQDGDGSEVSFTDDTSASATTIGFQMITIDDVDFIISGTVYMEQAKTMQVGDNTFTFENAAITADSGIDVWASIYGMNPKDVQVDAGQCDVIFESESAVSMTCRIYIR